MQLVASSKVIEKIRNVHSVEMEEVEEAWFLHNGALLEDLREEHKTNPPTVWFIAETMSGRKLKVVLVIDRKKGFAALRTAYEPDQIEVDLYESKK